MLIFDPKAPKSSLKNCSDNLPTDDPQKLTTTRIFLNSVIEHAQEPKVLKALQNLVINQQISHQVIGRYVLYKAQKITLKELLPFEAKNIGKVKSKCYLPNSPEVFLKNGSGLHSKFGYVVNLPIVILGENKDNHRINKVIEKFLNEGFHKTTELSINKYKKNLRVVIGGNRFKSIEKNYNRNFKDFVKNYQPREYSSFFGFLWEPKWYRNKKAIPLKTVRTYYYLLKDLDPILAEKWRKKQEHPKDGINDRVPYQEIREIIKNSQATKRRIAELRKLVAKRPIYLTVMDPDFKSLRDHDRGLFSHYNQMIKRHSAKYSNLPAVCSTGYRVKIQDGPILYYGIHLDQRVRKAISKVLPLGTYFPEPNMIIHVEDKKSTVKESFINTHSVNKESRQIIANVLKQRELSPAVALAFQTLGAVTTSVPNRFYTEKNKQIKKIDRKSIGSKNVLKALRSVRQSHINPLWGWALNVECALSSKGPKVRKYLAMIFNQFDPINMAYTQNQGRYSAAQNFVSVLKTYRIHQHFFKSAIDHFKNQPELRQDFILTDSIKDLLNEAGNQCHSILKLSKNEKEEIIALFQARLELVLEAYRALIKLKLSDEEIFSVIEAARLSGKAMYKDFKSFFQ